MKLKLQLCLKIPKNIWRIIVDLFQAKQRLDYWQMHELEDREKMA